MSNTNRSHEATQRQRAAQAVRRTQSIDGETPEAGYFLYSPKRGMKPIPARMAYGRPLDPVTNEPLDRTPRWAVRVGLRWLDIPIWPQPASIVTAIWTYGQRIDRDRYDELLSIYRRRMHEVGSQVGINEAPDISKEPVPF